VMTLRRLAGLAALCGMVVFVAWVPAGRLGFGSPDVGNIEEWSEHRPVTPGIAASERTDAPQGAAMGKDTVPTADLLVDVLPDAQPVPRSEPPPVHVTSLNTPDPGKGYSREQDSSVGTADQCLGVETCIDQYLWSVYQRAPKVDTIKLPEQTKVTVKKKGQTQTVTKTVMKPVDEDFTWKDPKAAQTAGMSLMDYVIGGMDRSFKLRLYHALRAMEDAGLSPGMTSGFRDDYRQSLASGNKAANDSSYHGGSRRGGYGHGLAADLVSVKGETRADRLIASDRLWKWIDEHGPDFGIARPYLDKDPPHVGPIDGQEYAEKRGRRILLTTALQTSKVANVAPDHIQTVRANASGEAPISRRQSKPRDLAQLRQLSGRDKKMKELDSKLANKLTGICRGC
jgi:hypothetical protein